MKFFFLTLWIGLASAPASFASETQPDWLIITTSGRDADGLSLFDRFEVTADRLAKWQTSSTGYDNLACADAGGRFEGRVSAEQAQSLTESAGQALESQEARLLEPGSPRSATISVLVGQGGKARAGEIHETTPEWKKLVQEIHGLRRSLEPEALVVLRAMKKEQGLELTFELVGEKSMELILPEHAEEAFFLNKGTAQYAKVPKKLQIALTKKTPRFSLQLKSAPKAANTIRYSNAVVLHHAEEKNSQLTARQELSLCTNF